MARTFGALGALAAFVPLVACHGGLLDVGTASRGIDTALGPQPPLEGGAALPGDGLAVFDGKGISALAVDGTHVYLAGESAVYAVPKTGGAPVALYEDGELFLSRKSAIVVDDIFVYFTNGDRVVRVPKAGGAAETVIPRIDYPSAMVVDATHIYVTVDRSFLPGTPPGPAILRAAKAGGPLQMVAGDQPYVTAMTAHADHLYFGAGYDDPQSSVRRVAKTGGPVEVLATGIDTRQRAADWISTPRAIQTLAVLPDRVAIVAANMLGFVSINGGGFQATATAIDDLLPDGENLIVARVDPATFGATLERLGANGAPQATLARWSYPPVENGMASLTAAVAMVSDGATAFWIDYDDHTASTTKRARTTLRSYALRGR